MASAKECATPMTSTQILQLSDGSPLINATKFRQVVGALQYLSLTRYDISFVVNSLAQFMHCPSQIHCSIAKRVLHYLKSTIHHVLFLKCHQPLNLIAFTSVDWNGDYDDRKSTFAYILSLGGNAISWCSNK